jgi:4-hydroxy-tetrahydrodipicolinate reductase
LDIELAVRSASNVIVSAEEAAFPWAANAAVADELDSLARRNGVTILGAGLNPGFSFDALVLTAAGAAQSVTSIRVDRVIDLSMFQESALGHLGVGFSEAEFDRRVRTNSIRGHIGFAESMSIVATRLGVELESVDRDLSPILARRSYQREHGAIADGQSAGICHRATGVANRRAWYEATFTAHIDLPSIDKAPLDEIVINGDPPVHLAIDPGVSSQMGAAAMIANSVRRVNAAPPGWLTVGDLPPAIPE